MNKKLVYPYIVHKEVYLKYLTPVAVATEIQKALEEFGEDNVTFECEAEYNYGDSSSTVYLDCKRAMTDKEIDAYNLVQKKIKKMEEKKELETLAELKKKYEKRDSS